MRDFCLFSFPLKIHPKKKRTTDRLKNKKRLFSSAFGVWQRKGIRLLVMGMKQLSGAQKRKKKKEREEDVKDMERLKLGPTKLWTGLVLHHKDVFVSHVISKLNGTDRFLFSDVNSESRGVLAYAGVDVSKLGYAVYECSSISTLEWAWNNMPWGKKRQRESVIDQAWFCAGVAGTNKLELLKWAREVKHCKWDEAVSYTHLTLPTILLV